MYTSDSLEPPETEIKLCPCCASEAQAAVGRATVYIQCINSECGLATKGWPNFEKANRAWNKRIHNLG